MAVRGGLAIACAIVVSACGLIGPTPPPQPPRQTSMGLAISSLELKNGLRVVLVRDDRASEVQVTMRYRVGAKDDPVGQEGVAHLVEHLMYQQVLGGQSLFAKLESFATFFNAFTSHDATTYIERAAPSHLEEMLSVEAVRVGFRCTSVTDAVFVRERAVVVNELALEGEGDELAQATRGGLYPVGHPYRGRVGGTAASVGAVTREQACAFADAHYAPESAVLVVSGPVTAKTLEGALGKFIAKIAKRDAVDPVAVPSAAGTGEVMKVSGPVDEERLIVAWSLPKDLAERAKVIAISTLLPAAIEAHIDGEAELRLFGDQSGQMIGVTVTLGDDESVEKATKGIKEALGELPSVFRSLGKVDLGEAMFDQIKQSAIYRAYAALDDTSKRDSALAAYVLAGLEPAVAIGQAFAGLREMNRTDAAVVAGEVFRFDHAAVVAMQPETAKKAGREAKLAVSIHEIGQHRDVPEPADASKPANGPMPAATIPTMTTRVLPNGLTVVLLPVTSVPTVDIRLIFGAGSADDLPDRRGAALVAGYGLGWDSRYFNDYLLFSAAGGSDDVSVSDDVTVFGAQGLDMHIDVLLAGLRRRVRDGTFRKGEATVRSVLKAAAAAHDDQGALTDAWAVALYGDAHPYARAGFPRHASKQLSLSDAKAFRAAHFTPDNATLVISGRFDGPLADRWIDFLFGDWKGQAQPRGTAKPAPTVASLARDADTTQIGVAFSFPAHGGTRAQQLVAAAMLDEIAGDIRHQLGASYALDAALFEERLSTMYFITGSIDAGRARDAMDLVRSRLEKLTHEPEAAARAFIAARSRVLARLAGSEGTAEEIASRVQVDVQLGRPPLSDLKTAGEVHQLTVESMSNALADLDITRAAIRMRGPAAEVDAAFAAFGRTAQHVAVATDEKEVETADDKAGPAETFSLAGLADALTSQPPSTRLRLTVVPFAFAAGKVLDHGVSGYGFALSGEFRIDRVTSFGLHASIATMDGTHDLGTMIPVPVPIEVLPITVSALLRGTAYDRVWGGISIGFHANRYKDASEPTLWEYGVGVGLQAGADILKLGRHRAGLFAGFETDLFTTTSTTTVSLGLAYRL